MSDLTLTICMLQFGSFLIKTAVYFWFLSRRLNYIMCSFFFLGFHTYTLCHICLGICIPAL